MKTKISKKPPARKKKSTKECSKKVTKKKVVKKKSKAKKKPAKNVGQKKATASKSEPRTPSPITDSLGDILDAVAATDLTSKQNQDQPAHKNTPKTIKEQKRLFLERYSETASHKEGAKAAGVSVALVLYWRKNNDGFEERYLKAKDAAIKFLEDCAIERGSKGMPKPVYQRGRLVGYEQVYSDGLLQFMLKAMNPKKFRERISVAGHDDGPVGGLTKETANFIRSEILGTKGKE